MKKLKALQGAYKIGRQFARTLFERLEHHPRTHPYKRSSVIKVSDRISEMYLTLQSRRCLYYVLSKKKRKSAGYITFNPVLSSISKYFYYSLNVCNEQQSIKLRIYFYLDSFLWLPAQLGFYFCTKVIHGHFTGFYVGDQEEGVISGGVGVCVCV